MIECYSWEMTLNIGLDMSFDNIGLERNTGESKGSLWYEILGNK